MRRRIICGQDIPVILIGCHFKVDRCKVDGSLTVANGNLGVVESTLDVAVEQLGLDRGHEEDGGGGGGDGADGDVADHSGDSARLACLLRRLDLGSLRRVGWFRGVR